MRGFQRILSIGAALALVVASTDATGGFAAFGSRFRSLAYVLTGSAGVILAALVMFFVVRWLIGRIAHGLRDDDLALDIAAAAAVGAMVLAFHLNAPHTRVIRAFEAGVSVLLGAALSAGLYTLVRDRAGAPPPERLRRLCAVVGRALPLAFPLGAVAAWIGLVSLGDVTSMAFMGVLAVLLLAWAGVTWLGSAMSERAWSAVVLSLAGVVVVLGVFGGVSLRTRDPLFARHLKARTGGAVQHVILLSVDTLRRDDLSCYGSTTVATPNIDRIAADGCLFKHDVSASSWTLPAFASLMTGLPVRVHGVSVSTSVLPDTVTTLAERMRQAGYATDAMVNNLILGPARGFAQGFDGFEKANTPRPPTSFCEVVSELVRFKPIMVPTATRDITNTAIRYVKERKNEPFFLWVHYLDPHMPYEPPRKYVEHMNVDDQLGYQLEIESGTRPNMDLFSDAGRRAWARSLYDGEVRYVDAQIGRFLDALKAADIYDDALIVFAVDHGEEFWDHDGLGHGHALYNELVEVPLIIKAPGSHAPRVVDDYVSGVDVTPTILDMCDLPPVASPDAVSLRGYVDGTSAPSRPSRIIYSGGTLYRTRLESVFFDGWKCILSDVTGNEELFNLKDDPGEKHEMQEKYPAVAAQGKRLIEQYINASESFRVAHGIPEHSVTLDKDELELLRSLGYL